jgi:PAS domain S-box-containing protein
MSAIFGYQDSSLTGKQVSIISPGREETERILRELMICIDDAGWGYANAELVKKDGTAFSARLQTRPVDRKDPLKGEVLVITDMTDRKRLEDALKESEFRYRELQQNTSSIILRIDPHGTITFFNKYAQSFFDYAPEAVTGKNVVGTIVPAKGRSGHDQTAAFTDIGFSQDGYAIAIHENMRKNGDRVWVAWTKKAIRDESGHVAEILCIGNDITDHRKTDEVRISTDSWREQVIADTDIKEDVFDAVFHVCAEISLEGREGKPVGTAFLLGDVKNVLENSRQLILNPFEGHKPETRMITNYDLKENIKEIAQLDGAFVISGDGVIEAAGRHITIDTSAISIPKGMGTRHSSVAGITQATNAIGIVVSQSGGRISIFKNGKIVKVISL